MDEDTQLREGAREHDLSNLRWWDADGYGLTADSSGEIGRFGKMAGFARAPPSAVAPKTDGADLWIGLFEDSAERSIAFEKAAGFVAYGASMIVDFAPGACNGFEGLGLK